MNTLIKYRDLWDEIQNYTSPIIWRWSKEELVNNWLNPICTYIKENSTFYGTSDELDKTQ